MSIKNEMSSVLKEKFSPEFLEIIDESDKHAGHAGSAGFHGESHFKVTIISSKFCGLNQIERHREVYLSLHFIIKRIHALALTTKAPGE